VSFDSSNSRWQKAANEAAESIKASVLSLLSLKEFSGWGSARGEKPSLRMSGDPFAEGRRF
jgi:hypothetical protein